MKKSQQQLLQSRIAKRANYIRHQEAVVNYIKSIGGTYRHYKNIREELKVLAIDQKLDRELLQMVYNLDYFTVMLSQYEPS